VKVLWVTERFPPDRGGAAASAARQVASLAPHVERLDVLRLCKDLPPGRAEVEDVAGARVHRVGRAAADDESLQILAATAANLLAVHRHDLVHGFYAVHAGYVAAQVAREAGVPSVVSLRGNDLDRARFHGPRLPFLLWTLERADALVVLSDEMRRRVRSLAGREAGVHLVRNAVDPDVFRPDGPVAAFAGAPRPWIGFSGELRLKKGLPLLEELAARLAERGAGTLFWIGGRRDDATPLPRALAQTVREVPWTDDPAIVASSLRAMDLMVFPSLWEGMPNALLESMACGRPVLASAVGAVPEVVRDGVDGFLLAPARLGEFAGEAMRVAALPAESLRAVGAAARARVVAEFSPAAERDGHLALWRSLLPATDR
jgi:glycosyltransferase involved in cell wall biosynthesis